MIKRLFITALIISLPACSAIKPQEGGKAVFSNEKIVLQQNENSAEPSQVDFQKITVENYSTTLGTHQVDKARESIVSIKKLQSLNKLYWFGFFFILLGIAAIALKSYLPFLGIKVPMLSICIGVLLCMLPSALSNTGMRYAIMGVGFFAAYVIGRKYTISESNQKTNQ